MLPDAVKLGRGKNNWGQMQGRVGQTVSIQLAWCFESSIQVVTLAFSRGSRLGRWGLDYSRLVYGWSSGEHEG